MRSIRSFSLALLALLLGAGAAQAQTQIPPQAGPVGFCGRQPAPAADAWQVVVTIGGGAPTTSAVTMITPASEASALKAFCDASAPGWTHAFALPSATFPIGTHTVHVRSTNAFGTTTGPGWTVAVGLAPGPFELTAAGVLPAE